MKIRFLSLGSGSSGNCYFLGTDSYGILIDAGIGSRKIKKILAEYGITWDMIFGVFVTHDHNDHIKAVSWLGEKQHIPVYATRETVNGINRCHYSSYKLETCARFIEKDMAVTVKDMSVTPIEVSHDANDNVGYFITIGDTSFSFFTDLGYIGKKVGECIKNTDYLIIEANYDDMMLETGNYPPLLKSRIKSETGHLSNAETANFLAENFASSRLKHIWLCHLSKENNYPQLAYRTVELALSNKGITVGKHVQLTALERTAPTGMFEMEV